MLKRAALLASSLLFLFAIGELATRVVYPEARFGGDPRLASRYHPHRVLRYTSAFGEFDVTSRYNAVGMRDRDHASRPGDGVRRVLVLGDSFMEAKQVPYEESFPFVLEQRLSTHGPTDVVNTGHSGFGTIEQHLVLRHFGVDREPDVVVQAFFMNDVYDDFEISSDVVFGESGEPLRLKARGPRSRFAMLLAESWSRLPFGRKTKLVERDALGELRRDPFAIVRRGGFLDDDEHWARTLRSITASAELARASGARFLLMVIPLGQQVDPSLADAVAEAWSLEPGRVGADPQERLRRLGRERGIAVLDLLPILARHRDQKLYYAHDGHWTPAAHEIAAEAAAREIEPLLASGERAG